MRSVYSYPYLVVILAAVLCNLRIGIWLGGWTMPVLAGFQVSGSELNTANAHVIDQWLYLLMEISLCWFSCFVVGCLSLMISVLVRSTAAGVGIMLATLISGAILSSVDSTWESAKYLFMVNLQTNTFFKRRFTVSGFIAGSRADIAIFTCGISCLGSGCIGYFIQCIYKTGYSELSNNYR